MSDDRVELLLFSAEFFDLNVIWRLFSDHDRNLHPQNLLLYRDFNDLRKSVRPMCAREKRAQNFFGLLTESTPNVTH
jgi:hypothetical protein